MEALFVNVLNMSITAGYVVIAVVLLRLLLRKAPKRYLCLLWGLVAFRLLCPFSVESVLSLIPSATTVTPDIFYENVPQIQSGIGVVNQMVNPVMEGSLTAAPGASVNPIQIWMWIGSIVWRVGIMVLLIYGLISYLRLKKKLAEAVPLQDNIYQSDRITSAFVFGFVNPRIYLPFDMEEKHRTYVVAHEKVHIRRGDHWLKLFASLLLVVYWFHPLMWLAYHLFCMDLELACDERVIWEMGEDAKKSYSGALLACSVKKGDAFRYPLAFGESGIRQRVKNVLRYKKPALWTTIVGVVCAGILGICLLVNPVTDLGGNGSGSYGKQLSENANDIEAEGVNKIVWDASGNIVIPETTGEFSWNYKFGEVIYTNPLSSYMPNEHEMEKFGISKDVFLMMPSSGTFVTPGRPAVDNPVFGERKFSVTFFVDQEFSEAIKTEREKIFAEYDRIKMYEILNEDKTSTGFFLICADEDRLLGYQNGNPIASWIIRLKEV